MIRKSTEKAKAVKLRRSGSSYEEILEQVPVSKSTLSLWLKDLPLTHSEREYLKNRSDTNISRGRIKAAAQLRKKRQQREQVIYMREKDTYKEKRNDKFFALGVSLYWAEGSNKTPIFHFVNSDTVMVMFMYNWIQRYLNINAEDIGVRIYMHKAYSQQDCEKYWQKVLQLAPSQQKKTIFKPSNRTYKMNNNYHGCVRLEVSGVEHYRKMMAWKDCLKQDILAW